MFFDKNKPPFRTESFAARNEIRGITPTKDSSADIIFDMLNAEEPELEGRVISAWKLGLLYVPEGASTPDVIVPDDEDIATYNSDVMGYIRNDVYGNLYTKHVALQLLNPQPYIDAYGKQFVGLDQYIEMMLLVVANSKKSLLEETAKKVGRPKSLDTKEKPRITYDHKAYIVACQERKTKINDAMLIYNEAKIEQQGVIAELKSKTNALYLAYTKLKNTPAPKTTDFM